MKGDELRRFVHLPSKDSLRQRGQSKYCRFLQIRTVHDSLREHRRLTKENSATRTELQSIEQQLATLERASRCWRQRSQVSSPSSPDGRRKRASLASGERRSPICSPSFVDSAALQKLPTALGGLVVHDPDRMKAMEALLRSMFSRYRRGPGSRRIGARRRNTDPREAQGLGRKVGRRLCREQEALRRSQSTVQQPAVRPR